jgi:chromate transporter
MTERVRLSRLVQVFAWTGLTSLGGGRTAYFYDAMVMRRPWLTSREFIQDLTISQLLPGPSFSNLGVALGVRLAGWRGGAWGALAVLVPGALILLALTWLYFHVGFTPHATSAMRGMGAAVVGLVFVTTGRMIRAAIRDLRSLLLSAAIFLLVGPLHVNTALVIVLVVPLSLWLHRPRSGS